MSECPYFNAKGWHLYVGYRVKATGQTGECGWQVQKGPFNE